MPVNYTALLSAVLQPGIYQATKYVSPRLVIKATRRRADGKLASAHARQETVLVTIGQPNWRERHCIKRLQQAKEPFPVKKIQVRHA